MKSLPLNASSLPALATALISLTAICSPVQAASKTMYKPKVVNYTTAMPTQTTPYVMPYGYNDTARTIPQTVMAGISPSIIDDNDTSFEILALVRPGIAPVQKVSVGLGLSTNPLSTFSLKHINTLKNGDQFWKYTFSFEKGTFGKSGLTLAWGTAANEFAVQTTDKAQAFNGNPFPSISTGGFPAATAYLDTTQNDRLSYSTIKRIAPQIVMAGVSPAIVDIRDTSFDVVALVRQGSIPLQSVTLKHTGDNLFSAPLEKAKQFSNGDEIWVAKLPFPAGSFGTSTIPVVWGTAPGQYNLEVTDTAQQTSNAYPNIRSGSFAARP